jgi:hypothetical protein
VTVINKPQNSTSFMHSTAHIGFGSGRTFHMKVTGFDFNMQAPLIDGTEETTAASQNKFPTFYHTGRAQGSCSLSGFSVDGKPIGFANLPDETVAVRIDYAHNQYMTFSLAVESLSMRYDRKQVGIVVQLNGKISGKFPTTSISGGVHNPVSETVS